MSQVSEEKDHYLADFEHFEKNRAAQEPPWVHAIRRAAIDRFAKLSFPTPRDEEWRFTNVAPIVKIPFRTACPYAAGGLTAWDLERLSLGHMEWNRLVFIDGLYSPELSSRSPLPEGVRVAHLAEALTTDADRIEPHLARYAEYKDKAFAALNTAFIQDGGFVYIPSGKVVEQPIHLLFISTGRAAATVSYPRNLIVLGRGGMATVIESYAARSGGAYFTNAVTEISAGPGAVLEHYKIQRESEGAFHIATTQVYQERDSLYSSFSLSLGAQLGRNDLNVWLDAEGSECALNGLYFVADHQHIDNHTFIDHAKPHGTSHELYKGILGGKARGIFNGKILVRPDAQQTDAHQTNKNLLVSDEALINTNPQLEILADDVKCTHGATVGQLDEEAIFYFKSRGINQEAARHLLTYGFASDVMGRIKSEPVRDQLNALVLAKLQQRSQLKEAS